MEFVFSFDQRHREKINNSRTSRLGKATIFSQCPPMTITLPDDPALADMGEPEILLDLACGAYAVGHVSRGVAARMAGMDRHAFDEVLFSRRIPSYDEDRLAEDLATVSALRNL